MLWGLWTINFNGKKWFTVFSFGLRSTEDAERSGRPKDVSTPEIIEKIHDMVLADRRLKLKLQADVR
uniref:SFRICE_035856 n=1 Tax=Spodoptera frugiperda TaxID=7108 RepID=A0A2H1WDP8_SPOFR